MQQDGWLNPPENWRQIEKFLATDGAGNDMFGFSVSISGDTALIGELGDAGYRGAAYVFTHTGANWTLQQKLVASDGEAGDWFGVAVSIDGDTVLIGAQWDDDNGGHSGSAYVFHRTGTIWTQEAKLLASDGEAGDHFGQSVSLSGGNALIGAYYDDDKGVDSGSAYVFTRYGTTWTQEAKLLASDGAAGDTFGNRVSIAGNTAIIGAPMDDDNGENSGSVYVFTYTGSTWTQQQKILATDGAPGDLFGFSVSIDGNTALIGAFYNDNNGVNSGSAYVFTRIGTSWVQQQKLIASDGKASDNFGYSVSLAGDTALIGAHGVDDNGHDSGSAYVFTRTGTTWTQEAKLLASDGAAEDWFGVDVSLSGHTALIGAPLDDDNGYNSGSAYVFTKESENQPPITNFTYTPENPSNIDIIQFTDTSTDLDGTIVSWLWDFGDGINSTEQNPTHRYIHGGTYTVTLTVTDNNNAQDTIQSPVEILTVNYPPNTPDTPSGPIEGIAGIEYLYITSTIDPNGDAIKYGWDWDGDCVVDEWTAYLPSGTVTNLHHNWPDYGIYEIRVKAKDKYGLESTWSEPLQITMYKLGDVNNDGFVTWRDIDPLVAAMNINETVFETQHPGWEWLAADCNQDGYVTWRDIDPFVGLIGTKK